MAGTLGKLCLIVCTIGAAVLLHGCGDDVKTTTTTTTTQLIIPSRSTPLSPQQAATLFNKLYLGLNASNASAIQDPSIPLGVTVSMAANDSSFTGNLFCSEINGVPFEIDSKQTKCYKGQADCRMSACLISKNWMINSKTKALTPFGQRSVGYVFNQTLVATAWTKCSYMWDGASANNLNRGCGSGAKGGNQCESKQCAFYNKCGKTECTAQSEDVKRAVCNGIPSLNSFGGGTPVPATHDGNAQCVFPGVAFDYHGQDDYKAGMDGTREMVAQRVKYNQGTGSKGPDGPVVNIELNNEIVIDEQLMLPDIWKDPVAAIPAFIYAKSNAVIAKQHATTMRDEYCRYYHCEANGGGKVPVIMVDDTTYRPGGPFSATSGESVMVAI